MLFEREYTISDSGISENIDTRDKPNETLFQYYLFPVWMVFDCLLTGEVFHVAGNLRLLGVTEDYKEG